MRILITGWRGTLGRPLADELRRRGHEVFGCDLSHDGTPGHTRADIANYRELQRVFADCHPEAVYHLAAEFGRHNGEEYFERLWRTNLVGTRNVMELCEDFGARMFFASSSEVYGEGFKDCRLSETLLESTPPLLTNEYAISKWTNELQIRNFQLRSGSDITILRFFNAYGPGETYHPYRSVVALFCHRALYGIPFTVYKGYARTFMFISDFIPTLANVCEADLKHDVYNIGGHEKRSVENLADLIFEHTGADRSLAQMETFERHNVVSKDADISRAVQDLGHNPTISLEEGVPATIEWMRSLVH